MINCKILEYDDEIAPDDLVRDVYPASYYCAYSDDVGESIIKWKYAKFSMPGWIGKTLRQYRNFGKDTRQYAVNELIIIRVPSKVTKDQLNTMGIPIHIPSAPLRRLHYQTLGKSKFGNMDHRPREVTLEFGKYKGKTVEDIYDSDPEYLRWVYNNVKLNDQVKESIRDWLTNDMLR
jgi:hypothetical protein